MWIGHCGLLLEVTTYDKGSSDLMRPTEFITGIGVTSETKPCWTRYLLSNIPSEVQLNLVIIDMALIQYSKKIYILVTDIKCCHLIINISVELKINDDFLARKLQGRVIRKHVRTKYFSILRQAYV